MAIILRFVDNKGFIQERFFGVIHLEDTSSATLYSSIYATLSSYLLPIENICGQGYDGASNMRGEWNRLQSFFLKVNPFNGASCKRQDELPRGCSSCKLKSIATDGVFIEDKKDGLNFKTRGGASSALKKLTSFDFVFILHMMKTILGHADVLCKALQQKDQEVNLSSDFLDPRDGYVSFNSHSILKLAKKYYYLDFTEQELDDLEFQLKHFELDMKDHLVLGKLIRLVLNLLVSTASVKRAFSAMKIMKNILRNKMGGDFLSDNLVLYIEKDIAKTFSLDSVLDDFSAKKRRVRHIYAVSSLRDTAYSQSEQFL
ncbi:zinc finger MYM-type protein 1-like protein [Tanacetum coccineum]